MKTPPSLRYVTWFSFAVFLYALGSAAAAQDFPTRPIRIIVSNSPGVAQDLVPRAMAPDMTKSLGQAVIVENKPGAEQLIGFEYVAKQVPADGYTILAATTSVAALLPVTVKDLRFDPLKDLQPVISLVEGRLLLVSSTKYPWKSFTDLVAYAKANPGKLNYGSSSPPGRLVMEALIRDLGLSVVHVPYNGGGPYYAALQSGEIEMGIADLSNVAAWGNKVRGLAVTGDHRAGKMPDVPTYAELGISQIPGFSFTFFVPNGTPKNSADRIYSASNHALQQPEVKAHLAELDVEVIADNTAESAARGLADQFKFFSAIAKRAGVKPQ